MSKVLKIILIILACLIPVGIIIFALGVFMGGKAGWSLELGKGGRAFSSEISEEAQDLDEFDYLEVDVSSVDVYIMQGDSFKIGYKTRAGHEPEISREGRNLTVRQPSKGFVIFDFGFSQDLDVYTITVPEGKSIKVLARSSSGDIEIDSLNVYASIDTSSGDILFNDTEGERLEATTSSGEIEGDKVKNKNCVFTTSSGDIGMLRMFSDELQCRASSGDIGINNSEISRISCATSSGEVEMDLQGQSEDYSWDIRTSSGDIVVNGVEHKKEYTSGGSTVKSISAETSSGDIDVTMK